MIGLLLCAVGPLRQGRAREASAPAARRVQWALDLGHVTSLCVQWVVVASTERVGEPETRCRSICHLEQIVRRGIASLRAPIDADYRPTMTSSMIVIAPGQVWSPFNGDDAITIHHSVGSRWLVTDGDGDTFETTAAAIRALYRHVDRPVRDEVQRA